MKYLNLIFFLSIIFLTSCEDVIQVDLDDDQSQLVVDAWINNITDSTQTIRLTRTQGYFNSAPAGPVLGATVLIVDNEGNIFDFEDTKGEGNYQWTPPTGEGFGQEGNEYALSITLNGEEYNAISTMKRTIPIDSIHLEERIGEVGFADGIWAQVFARDIAGGDPDLYWIKSFKNGQFLNKPQEINLAYDGAFGPGFDGELFIPPIRDGINRIPETEDDAVDNDEVAPWMSDDQIHVEIHSLNLETFYYLLQAQEQMTTGDAGIFATPIANTSTNIFPQSEGATEEPLGFFNISMVSMADKVVP